MTLATGVHVGLLTHVDLPRAARVEKQYSACRRKGDIRIVRDLLKLFGGQAGSGKGGGASPEGSM